MKRTPSFPLAVASCAALLAAQMLSAAIAPAAAAASRPRYGGTLRVLLQARVDSLDPREWPQDPVALAARERIAALLFERLVRLDEKGLPQPDLALSWESDAARRRWKFRLRPGVRFHDSTPLTPRAVAACLAPLAHDLRILATDDSLLIESSEPQPQLLFRLARWQFAIVRMPEAAASADPLAAIPVGTGPFRPAAWQPRQRLELRAFEDHWAGRPFLDAVEIRLGVPLREQSIEFELGRADLIELGPAEWRRASLAGRRVWASAPAELLLLAFLDGGPVAAHPQAREALALSLDRAAFHTVLLQRQGEPSAALLPQWLSGYAFLFRQQRDVARARALWAAVPSPPRALLLDFDAGDALLRAIAERMVVNAHEAGIPLQLVAPSPDARPAEAHLRLWRLPLRHASAALALDSLAAALALDFSPRPAPEDSPETCYAAERALLAGQRLLPLAHIPMLFGLSPRLRNWMPTRLGDWRLADAWLDSSAERKEPSAAALSPRAPRPSSMEEMP